MKQPALLLMVVCAAWLGSAGSAAAWGDRYYGHEDGHWVGYYPHGGPVYAYYRNSPACDFPVGQVGGPYVGYYGFTGYGCSPRHGSAARPVYYAKIAATCCHPAAQCCVPSMNNSACCLSTSAPVGNSPVAMPQPTPTTEAPAPTTPIDNPPKPAADPQ